MNLFYNSSITKKFAKEWSNRLIYSDKELEYKSLDIPFEHYTMMLFFQNIVTSSIGINIEKTVTLLDQLTFPKAEFSLSKFGEFHQYSREHPIIYTHYDVNSSFSTDPIVILRSEFGLGRTVVIDGNHRVSFAKYSSLNQINGYFIDENFLLANDLLLDTWSKDYLLFSIDLHQFLEYKKNKLGIIKRAKLIEQRFFKKYSFLFH